MSDRIVNMYADALVEAAIDSGQLENVINELATLKTILPASHDMRTMLKRADSIPTASAELGSKLAQLLEPEPLISNLLKILSQTRRLQLFPSITLLSELKLKQHLGIKTVKLTSARVLSEEEQAELVKRLEKIAQSDVEVDWQTDSSILGGFRAEIGFLLFDGSLRTRVKLLRDHLLRLQGDEII